MRITGTLHTIGSITICENYPQEFHDDLNFETVQGILITSNDEETHRAASNLLCATVDIYQHPVNGLVAGECTPENYAHALARLAHTEEHLAREVRSSQALAAALEAAQASIGELTSLVSEYRKNRELHRQLLAIAEGSAAKYEQKYLDASRALGEARAVLVSVDLANARLMADGEECDGDPDERGRDENGNALA